jgi:hypothetical protein|tara:strand:- start:2386 stop:3126 length:741 start_codon:yes stop_codon:yes gene_type:complete
MKTISTAPPDPYPPIKWTPYNGETITVNTIIRQGKKILETAFYEDKVKAVPRGNAYIIGNGPSRKDFDLNKLKATGQTYGCNALYRDFVPDYIFSVDTKMTVKMCEDKVYEKCFHYAPSLEVNRPYSKGKLHLVPNNPHWISGNQAMWTACVHGHKNIFLIGFDFREYGKDQFNNIYQDTSNYGERHGDAIFEGWLGHFRGLQKMRLDCKFTIVHDNPPDFLTVAMPGAEDGRFKNITYKEFTDII